MPPAQSRTEPAPSRRGENHLAAALAEACRLTGADRAAVMTQQAAGRFVVTAATHDADLRAGMTIDQLVSPLWPVLLQRSTLEWSADGDAAPRPLPFAGDPGWRHVHARGLPFERGTQGLLVLGSDDGALSAEADANALDVVSRVCALLVDNRGLRADLAAVERMLTAAVNVAARSVDATSPEAIRTELLNGLVNDMGMAGAVLWEPEPDGSGLRISRHVGLPDHVREALERPGSTSIVARLYRADLNVRLVRGASAQVSTLWPGMWVRLVRVGPPAAGVLAVYTAAALPEAVDAVMATLSQALSRAVHQAMLRDRTQRIADALVAELRPQEVTLPAGIDVGFVYRSATRGVPVGGDFFDWFALHPPDSPLSEIEHPDDGRFGVVCGDVSGKGLEAASLTTMAVYSLRAFALPGGGPAEVLGRLNTALCSQTSVERFATVAYALLDPRTGDTRLALAGHPVPVLLHDGEARLLDVAADVPAGMFADRVFTEHHVHLGRGDSLVLVTDGVTEARRQPATPFDQAPVGVTAPDGSGGEIATAVAAHTTTPDELFLGERRLLSALQARDGASAQELANAVWEAVVEWTGGATSDDCAIVVLRRS